METRRAATIPRSPCWADISSPNWTFEDSLAAGPNTLEWLLGIEETFWPKGLWRVACDHPTEQASGGPRPYRRCQSFQMAAPGS